jgi:hypothetical protein
MMAFAKARAPDSLAADIEMSRGNFPRIFWDGKRTPIMPVEEGKISPGEARSKRAVSRQTWSQARMP